MVAGHDKLFCGDQAEIKGRRQIQFQACRTFYGIQLSIQGREIGWHCWLANSDGSRRKMLLKLLLISGLTRIEQTGNLL